MSNVIEQLESEQMQRAVPDFSPGDTVVVQVRVSEGNRERLQAFEGVCIAKRNRGLNSSFTVRKMSHGEGVERAFQTYSPLVAEIQVKRRGKVRRAKLYYLRGRTGKAARIRAKAYVLDVRFEKAFESDLTERVIEGFRAASIGPAAILHRNVDA